MSVSGVSSSVAGSSVYAAAQGEVPGAGDVTAQKTQNLSTEVTVSVMKLMMDEEKAIHQGILDMLV